jgi:hypothetical protein
MANVGLDAKKLDYVKAGVLAGMKLADNAILDERGQVDFLGYARLVKALNEEVK